MGRSISAGRAGEDEPLLLVLKDVRRRYPMGEQVVTALDGIDLAVRAGEFVAIIGPSGSGKSTLLNILGCLDQPSEGSYRVAGRETGALDAGGLAALRRRTFGFVFQGYNLMPSLSACANVELPGLYAGVGKSARRARAADLLVGLGLGALGAHRPSQMSGGQQQRVGIARALMNGGAVILADEPTGALDSRTGSEVMSLFRTLCSRGHTVLIVTHDMEVAKRADRIIEIRDGRVVADHRHAVFDVAIRPATESGREGGFLRGLDVAAQGLRMIATHRLRNALTLIGIVVGIAAVILASDAGRGAQKKILTEMAGLGVNQASIVAGDPFSSIMKPVETLGPRDLERLEALPFVDGVMPEDQKPTTFRYRDKAVKGQIVPGTSSFLRVSRSPLAEGRPFTDGEVRSGRAVLLLNELMRSSLFGNTEDPIGATVLVDTVPARVIGVISTAGVYTNFTVKPSAAIPYTAYRARIGGANHFTFLTLGIRQGIDRLVALGTLDKLLASWHGRHDFFLEDRESFREARLHTQATLTFLTTSLATISLLVGSIGVTNMLLVSVAERTPEIGILMAMGARRSDILLQFIVEAIVLCLVGGVLGIVLAYAVETFAGKLGLPATLLFDWETAFAGLLVSSLAGLAAGILPARRAAAINPVEAISR